ncbi:methionine adenosyltransferase, partial [Klebsiella pneumoniae]
LPLLVREFFALRPYGLIQMLALLHPTYKEPAAYGHLGREHCPGEKPNKAALLREAAGLK